MIELAVDGDRQLVKLGHDRLVERAPVLGEFHCLMLAGEQPLAGEILQRGDAARERRRRERKFARGCLGRAELGDPYEGFERAQGWQTAGNHSKGPKLIAPP